MIDPNDQAIALASGGHVREAIATLEASEPSALTMANLAELYRLVAELHTAEAYARRALILDPGFALGWTNLANILAQGGHWQEGEFCAHHGLQLDPGSHRGWQALARTFNAREDFDSAGWALSKALTLAPGDVALHMELAGLFLHLGELDSSEAMARRGLKLDPRNPLGYLLAAQVALTRGEAESALRWLDILLKFAPTHPVGLLMKSRAALRAGLESLALDTALAAMEASPGPEPMVVLGDAMQVLGDYQRARELFSLAGGLGGLIQGSRLEAECGNFDLALDLAIKAAETEPSSALAHYQISTMLNGNDSHLDHMLKLTQRAGPSEAIFLWFAIGKEYLDLGCWPEAFEAFAHANKLKRSTFHYDVGKTESWFETCAEATYEQPVHPVGNLIFIVGMPRSGTTLVDRILASHPEIKSMGETLHLATASQTSDPGGYYLRAISRHLEPGKILIDKLPANFAHCGLITRVFPRAKIIHVSRSPMDTCVSIWTRLFQGEQKFAYDQQELGRFYQAYATLMTQWMNKLPLINVNYETLVLNPSESIRLLLGQLGLPWHEGCLHPETLPSPIRTASFLSARSPITPDNIGRGQRYAQFLQPLAAALNIHRVPEHGPAVSLTSGETDGNAGESHPLPAEPK